MFKNTHAWARFLNTYFGQCTIFVGVTEVHFTSKLLNKWKEIKLRSMADINNKNQTTHEHVYLMEKM